MANLPEVDQFDAGVYQLETTDPALGGANGIMNTPPKSLVNRTRYLLNRMLDSALSFVVDSGAKNAIVASFPQPVAALVDGMEVSFRVAVANDGGVTLKLTNAGGPTLPTLPLYGGDYNPVAGGELPAGATVRAKLNLSLNASNGGAWVAQSVAGGYARIPTAASGDTSTVAANMAAVFNATDGLATVNVSSGTDITLTAAQHGAAILKLVGTPTAPINLILPAGRTGLWVINNQQGGTNNITLKPSGGTGVVLPQPSAGSGACEVVMSDGSTVTFASTQNQASFTPIPITGVTGTTLTVPGGFTQVMVEKNGAMLEPGGASPDYTTSSPNITLAKAAVASDAFTVYSFNSFSVANAVKKSGDAMSGALLLAAGSTAPSPAANDNSQSVTPTAWIWSNILALVNSVIGSVTGVTQSASDSSTLLATTAWVKSWIGNFAGYVSATGTMTLDATSFGRVIQPPTGSSGGFTITLPTATNNQGRSLTIFNSSTGNITLVAGNFNTAYGSGTSIVLPPNSTAELACDGTSFNGVGGSAAAGSGVRPSNSGGVGQFTNPSVTGSGASSYWTLPAGGTWAYFVSNAGSSSSGVAAGGSNVMGPFTPSNTIGFCWRVA
jgi:hypothetical protein